MKKTNNINLGGYPFIIDEDVYLRLNDYLNTIEKHFKNSEGVCDIMTDIEARMAELFNETLGDRKIITNTDLDDVVAVMGTPEQFGAHAYADQGYSETTRTTHTAHSVKTGRRFFRDSDDKIIGGVCSGIAAYWGIEDPIWIRLIAGFLLLSGIGFFPYIILWIIIPSAKTSSDRLAMRGEAANVENIGRMIEDELNEMTDSISQFTDDFMSKKKDNTQRKSMINRFGDWCHFVAQTIIQVLTSLMNIILSIFGVNKLKRN
jgi:phage shock protein PspC (stress-responsive transcriptional regulator)